MSDKPVLAHDASREENNPSGNLALGLTDARDRAFQNDNALKSSSFQNLSDDLGHQMFVSSSQLLPNAAESAGLAPGEKTEASPHSLHHMNSEMRAHRIELAGQRKGTNDMLALSALAQASSAKTPAELRAALDNINKAAALGEDRCDRLSNILSRRHGDYMQEHSIKMQIEALKAEKVAGLPIFEERANNSRLRKKKISIRQLKCTLPCRRRCESMVTKSPKILTTGATRAC